MDQQEEPRGLAASEGDATMQRAPENPTMDFRSQHRSRRRSWGYSEVEREKRQAEFKSGQQTFSRNIRMRDEGIMVPDLSDQLSLLSSYRFIRTQSDALSVPKLQDMARSHAQRSPRSPPKYRRLGRRQSIDHTELPVSIGESLDDEDDDIPLTPLEGIFRPRRLSPDIKHIRVTTLKSSSTGPTECEEETSKAKGSSRGLSQRRTYRNRSDAQDSNEEHSDHAEREEKPRLSWKTIQLPYILHLSVFSILGAILRVFLARFFGGDCEDHSLTDFLTPISRQICVTANGRTLQSGGALFIDLPANMIGSFVMGLITPPDPDHALRLPWFNSKHPLQDDNVLHTGFSVGLCGSLTTFASWNSQMVVMLDGTHTELGSQIVSVIFGYLLGMMAAVASFSYGRQLSAWLQAWRNHPEIGPACSEEYMDIESGVANPASSSPPQENTTPNESRTLQTSCCRPKNSIFVLVAGLLAVFVVADVVYGIRFYRRLYLLCLLSPPGALLRWNLAYFNIPKVRSGFLDWVPWGTFAANIIGAVCSIIFVALADRFANNGHEYNEWTFLICSAIKTGFAGSLSTVSSMVNEIVLMSEKFPGQAKPCQYAFATTILSMLLSLFIYSMIVRYEL